MPPFASDNREFDLVLYGATGFVGKLIARYLATAAPTGTRIALAGRNAQRLTAVRAELPAAAQDWRIIIADADDEASLRRMVAQTRVVVTTVGPYAKYGIPLVLACADAGTDYADLTGEPLFVRESVAVAHDRAVATGARVIHSCGFDSVPSDLSVHLAYLQAREDGTGELDEAVLIATVRGGMSGGTIASGRAQLAAIADDASLRAVLDDPYLLSADRSGEPNLGPQSDAALTRASSIDSTLTGWVTSFVMAPHNTRIVRRSNSLLGWAYGKNFRYREAMGVGDSPFAPVFAVGVAVGLWVQKVLGPLAHKGFGPAILDRMVPSAGSGPSADARDRGHFTMRTFVRTTSGAKYRTIYAAQGDPGYKAAAVILGQVSLCLAIDRDRLSQAAGVLTPATVMAQPLTDRLRAAGQTIDIVREG